MNGHTPIIEINRPHELGRAFYMNFKNLYENVISVDLRIGLVLLAQDLEWRKPM